MLNMGKLGRDNSAEEESAAMQLDKMEITICSAIGISARDYLRQKRMGPLQFGVVGNAIVRLSRGTIER